MVNLKESFLIQSKNKITYGKYKNNKFNLGFGC